MGFRINNNIAALVAQGNLQKTQNGLQTSIERLSSGLRINRGADDAAGLTISEKLRGQIRGLNRAMANAQDGISLIQTAEGALNEDASILNRLRELAIQSQADSLTTNDRLEIQKEVDQLVDEVDRISKSTEFNTKKLLDGSANALVSTDNKSLMAHQVGPAGQTASGDYNISVNLKDAGAKQVQQSAILTDLNSGNKAGLSTKLKDITTFYDNDDNLILESPQTVTIRGNGQRVDVTISSDMSLQEFSNAIENEITKDSIDGGLGLQGSTFAFNSFTGQVIFESGTAGSAGEISISADEDIIRALGFQITTDSEAAAYKVTATTSNVSTPTSTSANTTSDRASGVVGGLDLQFELASEARLDGSVAGSETIQVGANSVIFTFHDTNAGENGQADGNLTAGVTVTLTANRSFTTASITTMVNNAIANANNAHNALTGLAAQTSSQFRNPGITASFDGYNLILTSSVKGDGGEISLQANQAAQDVLGIQTSKVTGDGGTNGVLLGASDISGGVTISGTGVLRVRVGDGDFNTNTSDGTSNSVAGSTGSDITFNRGSSLSATSIIDTFNTYFSANNVKAKATMTSDGKLELRSTETGSDAKVSIASVGGSSIAALGFVSGQNASGEGGTAAIITGSTSDSNETIGFTTAGRVRFSVTDKAGAQTGTIHIATESVTASESFTLSKEQITSIFNASTLNTTDVDYGFDAGNRLDFFSRSAGETSRIVLTSATTAQNTFARNAFGIDFSSATQGSGTTQFKLHVTDRSLKFQIGANQSQQMSFEVINTSAQSLGLQGLDITNVRSATRALGAIDKAVNTISSERSKLGSLQNRLTSTISNLNVTSTNLQATESKIRDVDIANETINFTRAQIMIQAGTAQLAQAKGLSQNALQLLQ